MNIFDKLEQAALRARDECYIGNTLGAAQAGALDKLARQFHYLSIESRQPGIEDPDHD